MAFHPARNAHMAMFSVKQFAQRKIDAAKKENPEAYTTQVHMLEQRMSTLDHEHQEFMAATTTYQLLSIQKLDTLHKVYIEHMKQVLCEMK